MTPVQHFQPPECRSSWNTGTVWSPASASLWRWSQMPSSHFLRYCYDMILMGQYDIGLLGVMVSFRPHTTELMGVVYQVPCAGCPATYVGQMISCLNQRLSEHRLAVESGEAATSTLAEHAWGAHHLVDWDKVRVLDHQPHHHQRLILESIHSRSQTRPLNRDTSMPQIYNSLFFK